MLPVVISNGLGIDSENLDLFINEKIGGLSLTERVLLILAAEGFSNAGLIADIPEISFKRLKRKFPDFKIHQSKNLSDFLNKEDVLIFQNNVVINKKQLQSTLDIINNQKKSTVIGGIKNSGIIFLKKDYKLSENSDHRDLNNLNKNLTKIDPKDPPIKLSTDEIGSDTGRDFLFDHISKNVSGWFSKTINSKISIPISKVLIKTSLHPNVITFIVGLIGISCGIFYAMNMPFVGAIILQSATILDRCDGEVARIKLRESKFGQWFDTALDQLSYFSMFLGISICMNNPKFFPFTVDNIIYKQLSILNILLYLIFLITILFFMLRRTQNGSLAYYPSEVDKIVPLKDRSFTYRIMTKFRFLLKREFFSPGMILVSLIGYETATILASTLLIGGLLHQVSDFIELRKKIDITY
ncbi:CDP-alcohol phosphatidyltransferase family protein [bacterium]|jgi:phosphatidylglycerophosphate synthase|nr:CDP-alcohol phosphatidyltransferase family protein [bacterium]MBT3795530.1 CDP-alcohol phosphatidyltransferase family protein [bacterium]MBT4634699.1 CDP-alcohol phosphatidyltransferase family protein [bacterium]